MEGKIRTSSGVQATATFLTFEVLRFLVGYEDLEVVEVALAVVAPWSLELLVEVWVSLPLFRHCGRGALVEATVGAVGWRSARRRVVVLVLDVVDRDGGELRLEFSVGLARRSFVNFSPQMGGFLTFTSNLASLSAHFGPNRTTCWCSARTVYTRLPVYKLNTILVLCIA